MFDPDVIHLIEGPNIDRPINALTLTNYFYQLFDDFDIYFEPTADQT
jgi:HNH endonuclease